MNDEHEARGLFRALALTFLVVIAAYVVLEMIFTPSTTTTISTSTVTASAEAEAVDLELAPLLREWGGKCGTTCPTLARVVSRRKLGVVVKDSGDGKTIFTVHKIGLEGEDAVLTFDRLGRLIAAEFKQGRLSFPCELSFPQTILGEGTCPPPLKKG